MIIVIISKNKCEEQLNHPIAGKETPMEKGTKLKTFVANIVWNMLDKNSKVYHAYFDKVMK